MKILITGDFFVSDPQSIIIDDSITQLMNDCDYRIINLEGPITWSSTKEEPKKSGPRLRQPEGVIKLLESLGTNMLTLANNHLMDYGIDGLQQTRTLLRGRCVLAGCGTWDEAYGMKVVESADHKIGVLNFCEMQFGMLYDEWSQDKSEIGCAWINHKRVNSLITKCKKQVDYLVAICHAGVEMIDVPLPEWRDRYREMIELGCDAVIAHHPHVVQGFEYYLGKPICYSLGNFCFSGGVNGNSDDWNIGALAILDIGHGEVKIDLKGCQLNSNCLSISDPKSWNEKIDRLCKSLEAEIYTQLVNKNCSQLMSNYWQLFAMGGLFAPQIMTTKNLARIPLRKYDHVHILNNIQCESHRWCIERALRNEGRV